MTRPLRVVRPDPAPILESGRGGVLGPDTTRRARWWVLALECGHTVERSARYRPDPGRAWSLRSRARSRSDVLPPPARVRCEECPREPS